MAIYSMSSQSKVAQAIAVIDLCIGSGIIVVASYQFTHGTSLIKGPVGENEKKTRLGFYFCIVYLFLLIQVAMAIKLFKSARNMEEWPIKAIKVFGWWREWSVVYLLTTSLHAILVILLMEYGQRKIICLACLFPQVILRLLGIFIIGSFKANLECDLPTKL